MKNTKTSKKLIAGALFIVIVLGIQLFLRATKIDTNDARFLDHSSNLEFISVQEALDEYSSILSITGINSRTTPTVTTPHYVEKPNLRTHVFDIFPGRGWTLERGKVIGRYAVSTQLAEEVTRKLVDNGWENKTSEYNVKTFAEATTDRQKQLDINAKHALEPDCMPSKECQSLHDIIATRTNSQPLELDFDLDRNPYQLVIKSTSTVDSQFSYIEFTLQFACTSDITCDNILLRKK